MLPRKLGLFRVIFTVVSLQVFLVSGRSAGFAAYPKLRDANANHNVLNYFKDKDSTDLVGCRSGDKILLPGEVEHRPRCTFAKCFEVNGTYGLEVRGCDPTNQIPPNCQLVPQQPKPFPDCCVIVMVCTEVYLKEVARKDTKDSAGINDLDLNAKDSPPSAKDPQSLSSNSSVLSTTQQSTISGASSTDQPTATPSTIAVLIGVERKKRDVTVTENEQHAIVEVCQIGNSTLEVGEIIPLEGCTQMKCVKDADGVHAVIMGCDTSNGIVPEGCTIQPKPDAVYPECCDMVFVCVKSIVKVIPVIVTRENISEIGINQEENLVESINEGFQSKTPDVIGFKTYREGKVPTNVTGRTSRQLDDVAKSTDTLLYDSQACEVNNRTLNVEEQAYFEGCLEVKCVMENETAKILVSSCPMPDDFPANCRVITNPELHYPDCCEITMICEKIITTLVPEVYTPANISQLDRNEIENMIGTEGMSDLMRNTDDVVKNEGYRETGLKTRAPETNETQVEQVEQRKQGCVIGDVTVGAGDVIHMQGCSQLECTKEGEEFILLIVRCDTSNTTVPEGCVINSKPELTYPACCEVEMLCENVVEVVSPVVITAGNINKLEINKAENMIKNDKHNEKDEGNPAVEDPPANFNLGTANEPRSNIEPNYKGTEGLVREKRAAKDLEQDPESCLVGNITLDVDATLSLPGCAQMICVPVNETLGIIIRSCVEQGVPKNCRIEAGPELNFPECCSKFMVCEQVITTVFPVVYTSANISDLQRNDVENMIENKMNTFVPDRPKREARSHRRRVEEREPGCQFGNKTLNVDETLPLREGCAQLKCISQDNAYSLVVVSCGPTNSNSPEGCVALPNPDQHYPQCCEVAYSCEKVVMTVFPVVYTAANISELERDETLNNVGFKDGNNKKKQNIIEKYTQHGMHVSQSKVVERTRVKPTPRKVDRTAKIEVKVQSKEDGGSLKFVDSVRSAKVENEERRRPQAANTNVRSRARLNNRDKVKKTENKTSEPENKKDTDVKETTKMSRRRGRPRIAKAGEETIDNNQQRRGRLSIAKTGEDTTDNNKEKEKSVANRGRNRYNYRRFFERSRRYANPDTESDVKPTFFLPVRSRRRSQADNSNAKRDDLDALELKNNMFVIVTPNPTTSTESSKEKEESTKKSTEEKKKPSKRRGTLSALISSRNLRTRPSRNKKSEEEKKKKETKFQEKKTQKKQKIKETKDENKETKSKDRKPTRKRLRLKVREGSGTDTLRIANRRRLYANRLNRFRAIGKSEDSEKQPSSVDDKKIEKKKDKETADKKKKDEKKEKVKQKEKVEKKEKKDTKKEESKSKETPRRNPVPNKIISRPRLSGRRRNAAVTKEIKTETEKPETKKEPPKRLTIRARANQDAKETESKDIGKVKIDEGYTKTRFQRRRSRPSKKPADTKEESLVASPQRVTARTKSRTKKPVFTLKAADEKKENLESRKTARGRRVFDLTNVEFPKKSADTKQVPVRNRVSSRSRNLRRRLKEERKTNPVQAAREHEINPEEIVTHITEPPVSHPEEIQRLPVQVDEREEEPHPYPLLTDPEEPIYGPEQEPDYSYIPTFKGLEEFDNFYEYPTDLHLSSSDKDTEKSPEASENEISHDPAAPPLKITTISFTSSRSSFKSSKTRNSSKNYKENPPVYGAQETFKSEKYR